MFRGSAERTGQPGARATASASTHHQLQHHSTAARIAKQYGQDLYRFCHMGKEHSVYAHALYTCLTSFMPDFRGLLDNAPVFDTPKHMRKLGLDGLVPGLLAQDFTQPDHFMKSFTWHSNMGPVLSDGIGINVWSLLLMASLIGSSNLHPKCASDFARNVLGLILRNAPRAATPGNKIPVRSFNTQTGKGEYLIIFNRDHNSRRPDHFVRPNMDSVFALTGEYTYCRGKGQFLPEDVLHCSHLMTLAARLHCGPHEVPARHLHGFYQLIPGQAYPLFRSKGSDLRFAGGVVEETDVEGSILVSPGKVTIRYIQNGPNLIECDVFSWPQRLNDLGLVILPVILRLGAAVWNNQERTVLGCLVPPHLHGGGVAGNFDPVGLRYASLFDAVSGPSMLGMVEVMNKLIPIGTAVWIKPSAPTCVALRPRFPFGAWPDAQLAVTAVRGRLSVPPSVAAGHVGKLYVTIVQCTQFNLLGNVPPVTVEVDPWELMPEGTRGFEEIRHVMVA